MNAYNYAFAMRVPATKGLTMPLPADLAADSQERFHPTYVVRGEDGVLRGADSKGDVVVEGLTVDEANVAYQSWLVHKGKIGLNSTVAWVQTLIREIEEESKAKEQKSGETDKDKRTITIRTRDWRYVKTLTFRQGDHTAGIYIIPEAVAQAA